MSFNWLLITTLSIIFGFLIKYGDGEPLEATEFINIDQNGIYVYPENSPTPSLLPSRNKFYTHLVPALALGNAAFLLGVIVGPRYVEYFKRVNNKEKMKKEMQTSNYNNSGDEEDQVVEDQVSNNKPTILGLKIFREQGHMPNNKVNYNYENSDNSDDMYNYQNYQKSNNDKKQKTQFVDNDYNSYYHNLKDSHTNNHHHQNYDDENAHEDSDLDNFNDNYYYTKRSAAAANTNNSTTSSLRNSNSNSTLNGDDDKEEEELVNSNVVKSPESYPYYYNYYLY